MLTTAEIARKVGGQLVGKGAARVSGVAGILQAVDGELTFLTGVEYAYALAGTRASAVLVPADWSGQAPCDVIKVADPGSAVQVLAQELSPPAPSFAPGVHATAVVDPTVEMGEGVSIGPRCVIEPGVVVGARTVIGAGCYLGHKTIIGPDCHLYPHVCIREYVRIGARVILHAGAVIGSDGFGYEPKGERWVKTAQVGTVAIGDDVEIGANTTIDRARLGKTVIGNGVKIDNLVQVAHNVVIGENTAIAALAGIAGSTVIGRHVQIGGQAGVGGHLAVGDNAIVGAQAGVTKSVPVSTFVSGYPAMPHDKALRLHAHVARLPALKARLAELEERLANLEKLAAMGEGRQA